MAVSNYLRHRRRSLVVVRVVAAAVAAAFVVRWQHRLVALSFGRVKSACEIGAVLVFMVFVAILLAFVFVTNRRFFQNRRVQGVPCV